MNTPDRTAFIGKTLLGAAVTGLVFTGLGLLAGSELTGWLRVFPSPLAGAAWLGIPGLILGGMYGGKRPEVFLHGAIGAFALGFIGFFGGFFGPMLLAPDANQGPLLGIFITGPIGFSLGGLIGLIVGLSRRRN